MFTGFEEKNQERVKLVDVDPHALSILVNYVYTSTVDVTEANVQTLLPAANLLQLIDVRDACCEFLVAQLHPTNALGIKVRINVSIRFLKDLMVRLIYRLVIIGVDSILIVFCDYSLLRIVMDVKIYTTYPINTSRVILRMFCQVTNSLN